MRLAPRRGYSLGLIINRRKEAGVPMADILHLSAIPQHILLLLEWDIREVEGWAWIGLYRLGVEGMVIGPEVWIS